MTWRKWMIYRQIWKIDIQIILPWVSNPDGTRCIHYCWLQKNIHWHQAKTNNVKLSPVFFDIPKELSPGVEE